LKSTRQQKIYLKRKKKYFNGSLVINLLEIKPNFIEFCRHLKVIIGHLKNQTRLEIMLHGYSVDRTIHRDFGIPIQQSRFTGLNGAPLRDLQEKFWSLELGIADE
jgi:hypothetical protein